MVVDTADIRTLLAAGWAPTTVCDYCGGPHDQGYDGCPEYDAEVAEAEANASTAAPAPPRPDPCAEAGRHICGPSEDGLRQRIETLIDDRRPVMADELRAALADTTEAPAGEPPRP